jgi:hypothetical protein
MFGLLEYSLKIIPAFLNALITVLAWSTFNSMPDKK